MTIQPLPEQQFLESFKLVPRLAICLQVRRSDGAILLTRRGRSMSTMAGAWHYPGAFLLLNETFEGCIARIAAKELGTEIVGAPRQVRAFQDLDGDPRGHVIDLVYEVELAGAPQPTAETDEIAFVTSIPAEVAFHHDRILAFSGLAG